MAVKTKDYVVAITEFTQGDGKIINAKGKTCIRINGKFDITKLTYDYIDKKLVITDTTDGDKLVAQNPSSIRYIKTDYNKVGKKETYNLTNLIANNLINNLNNIAYNKNKKAYVGTNYNDNFTSTTANETFIGGIGKNTFNYEKYNGGKDTIKLTNKETLILNLVDYYKGDIELKYANKNKNLVLYIDEENQITIKNFAAKNVVGTGSVILKTKENTDGVLLKDEYVRQYITTASNFTGTRLNDYINAKYAQHKTKKGKHVDLVFKGGAGNDIFESSDFSDKITGGTGENQIKYTSLYQLSGDKIYLTKGENLTIDLSGIYDAEAIGRVSGKHLYLTVTNGTESRDLILINYGTKDVTGAAGDVIIIDKNGKTSLKTKLVGSDTGTWHSDYIDKSGSKKGLTINGGAGDDIIIGSYFNDTIKAGTGLVENLTGGKGNDTLYASTTGGSKTTFNFREGDGKDTIYSGKGKDTIVLDGIALASLDHKFVRGTTSKTKDDLTINYTDTDSVTIKNYFSRDKQGNYTTSIKYLKTDEGTFDLTDILNCYDICIGEGNQFNNVIIAENSGDAIQGFAGKDVMIPKPNTNPNESYINGGLNGNKIYIPSGYHTIMNGGGIDTLIFSDIDNISEISARKYENHLILDRENGNIRLDNYFPYGHSVKYIQIGEKLYNLIFSEELITNGTSMADDIYVLNNQEFSFTTINAGEGDDLIHVTKDSNYPTVTLGAGDDTVSLEGVRPDVDIKFENGDGNNTLTGLNNDMAINTRATLNSNDIFHTIDLGENLHPCQYIMGKITGEDLILTLSGGETFTIKGYNTLSEDMKNAILVDSWDYHGTLLNRLKFEEDIVNLSPYETLYNETGSHKIVIAPDTDLARTLNIDGTDNDVIVKGSNEQNVNISANNTTLYIDNTGESAKNNVTITTNDNTIYTSGGFWSDIKLSNNLTGNKIYVTEGFASSNVTTSRYGSTYVNATGDSSIDLWGADEALLSKGGHRISIGSSDAKTITIADNVEYTNILDEGDYKSQLAITQNLKTSPSDIMFEHYADWRSDGNDDHIKINYFDKDGNILNEEYNNGLSFLGWWKENPGEDTEYFDLDTTTVFNNVTITAQKEDDTAEKKLSQMDQYIDMNHEGLHSKLIFTDKAQSGLLDNRGGVYIKGSDDYDDYQNYSFTDGKVTINDAGGDGLDKDWLSLNMDRSEYRFFIDIGKSSKIAGTDMIIFKHSDSIVSASDKLADGLYQYLSGNLVNNRLTIENEFEVQNSDTPVSTIFGVGEIEMIQDKTKKTGHFDVEGYFDAVKSDIAGWVNAYNSKYGTSFDSVSQAIQDGKATETEVQNLYNLYCNTDNWGTY